MPIDKKIELEIALRDSVSLTLQTIAKSLDDMSSKLTRGGESISDSADVIKKIEVHTKGVGERAKESTKSLMGMGDTIKMLTMAMGVGGGPLAAVALAVGAVVGVGKFMTGQARARIELKQMSEDTGISEDMISIMQRTQSGRGVKFDDTVKNIRQIGVNLNDMKARGEGSEAFKALADLGYASFGRELLRMLDAGNVDKAARAYFEQYEKILKEKGEHAARLYATEGVKLPESFLKGYLAASAGIQPAYRVNLEYAEKWLKFMEAFNARLGKLGTSALGALARALISMAYEGESERQKLLKRKSQIVAPAITSAWWREKLGLPPLSEDEARMFLEEKKGSVKKQKELSEIIMGWRDNAAYATSGSLGANPQTILRRQEGGPVTSGTPYLVGEKGPELFSSGGGQYTMVGEGGPEVIRPKSSGIIDKLTEAEASFRRTSESMTAGQLGVGIASGKLPTVAQWVLRGLSADTDNSWRTAARAALGIEDPGEIPPYKPGGAWDEKAMFGESKRWAGAAGEGDVEAAREGMDAYIGGGNNGARVHLGADILFNNVPPGVTTEAQGDGLDEFSMGRSSAIGAP